MRMRWLGSLALVAGLLAGGAASGSAATMDDASSCSSMHTAMMASHEKMSMMKPSGDADKDYMGAMSMMAKAMKEMNAYEMKCGKDPKTMKMATDAQKNYAKFYGMFDPAGALQATP